MNRPLTTSGASPLVPADPCFSLGALALRSASRPAPKGTRYDFFWARNAIFFGLQALGLRTGHKILVPAFVCAAAIEPMEHFGADVGFYAIQRDCTPDWQDLESRIDSNVRVILAVHYFGFPCDTIRFRALCDRYNLFLIEDCAHVLEDVPGSYRFGELGDFSVFSPRKYLPIFDGGRLRLNRPAPGFRVPLQFETPIFTLRVAKNLLDRRKPPAAALRVQRSHTSHPEDGRRQRELDVIQGCPQEPRYVPPDSTSFLPWMADFPMSRLSKLLARFFRVSEIAAKRRSNYSYLLEKLSRMDGVQALFPSLPADVVPWMLPLTLAGRREMDIKLRILGIPAVTWVSVRDPRISPQEFPDAWFLYECLVLLPIHQDLERRQLDLIAHAVTRVCQIDGAAAGTLNAAAK